MNWIVNSDKAELNPLIHISTQMNQPDLIVHPANRSKADDQSVASVQQLNSIQLLRGAAAVMVVAYHLSLFTEDHFKQVKLSSGTQLIKINLIRLPELTPDSFQRTPQTG